MIKIPPKKRGPKKGQPFFKMPKVEFDIEVIKEIKKRKKIEIRKGGMNGLFNPEI